MTKTSVSFATFIVCALASSASAGVNVDSGFAVGPSNEVFNSFFSFAVNVESSFNAAAQNGNVYEDRPCFQGYCYTLEDTPAAFNPMMGTSGSIPTNWMLHRGPEEGENHWLGLNAPEEPFESEYGNFIWSFARIYVDSPDETITLNQVRYERLSEGLSEDDAFESGDVSYEGTGYEQSLDRMVIGIHYGDDGEFNGCLGSSCDTDDVLYNSGNADTPVHEIWITADNGVAANVPAFSEMEGQAQLDETVAILNGEAPFTLTNEFWLEGERGETVASGSATITVNPTDMCPADLNGDENVNVTDLLTLLALWGTDGNGDEDVSADLDASGVVNVNDLLILLSAWGECPDETG